MYFEFFDGLMPWLILMVRGWFFIMMSWIAYIYNLVGACDSVRLVTGLVCIFLVWRFWFYLVLTLWLCI